MVPGQCVVIGDEGVLHTGENGYLFAVASFNSRSGYVAIRIYVIRPHIYHLPAVEVYTERCSCRTQCVGENIYGGGYIDKGAIFGGYNRKGAVIIVVRPVIYRWRIRL